MGIYFDPNSGQELWDGIGPPLKGMCSACGNCEWPNSTICRHSGFTIGSPKALKFCIPIQQGYVPRHQADEKA